MNSVDLEKGPPVSLCPCASAIRVGVASASSSPKLPITVLAGGGMRIARNACLFVAVAFLVGIDCEGPTGYEYSEPTPSSYKKVSDDKSVREQGSAAKAYYWAERRCLRHSDLT